MSDVPDDYEVHVWQIACDVGDAAIHVLVKAFDDPDDEDAEEVYEIQSAVLIDGGKDWDVGAKAIEDVINRINEDEDYSFADGRLFNDPYSQKKSLRFDSIVITHWDSDHYEGVLQLLDNGFIKTLNAVGPDPDRKRIYPSNLEDTAIFESNYAAHIPNWYCKYSDPNLAIAATTPEAMAPLHTYVNLAAAEAGAAGGSSELKAFGEDHCATTIYVPYSVHKGMAVKKRKRGKNAPLVLAPLKGADGHSGPFPGKSEVSPSSSPPGCWARRC